MEKIWLKWSAQPGVEGLLVFAVYLYFILGPTVQGTSEVQGGPLYLALRSAGPWLWAVSVGLSVSVPANNVSLPMMLPEKGVPSAVVGTVRR